MLLMMMLIMIILLLLLIILLIIIEIAHSPITSYFRNNDFWSKSSLTLASLRMFFARLANFKVDNDSTIASSAGEIIAIIVVLQLPIDIPHKKNRKNLDPKKHVHTDSYITPQMCNNLNIILNNIQHLNDYLRESLLAF